MAKEKHPIITGVVGVGIILGVIALGKSNGSESSGLEHSGQNKDLCHVVDEKDASLSGIVKRFELPNSHTVVADIAAVVKAFNGNPNVIRQGDVVTFPGDIVPHLAPLGRATAEYYPCGG